jgi:soluble lytic murein transglycosylase-like protein
MQSKSLTSLLGIIAVAAIALFVAMATMGPGTRVGAGWNYLLTGNSSSQSPAGDLHALARQDATDNGLNPVLFERQINVESGFNPSAVSPAGAQGIAQFEPDTAKGLGIDPWNATDSLRGAARLMAGYVGKYGDYSKALSAYNYGSAGTDSAMARCGWNWKTCVPAETQRYIAAIMGV